VLQRFCPERILVTMNDIKCPHCGKLVHVDEVLRHQLEKTILKEEAEKQKAELEKVKLDAKNEAQKKIDEERKASEEKFQKEQEDRKKNEAKIKEEASKEADEKHRLEKLEWEKQKADMQKAIEEAHRKGKQGSQQLQGDVLEKDLEEQLRDAFPNDDFKPVPTGVRGGDIIQEVKNKHGNSAGFILWEAKRTKAWIKDWPAKLKENMRNINASDCILVSDVLPTGVKIYDRIENTWVTSYEYAIKLASVVRYGLLNVAIAKSSASHTDAQLKELYEIITSDSFRQMFEARDEIIEALKQELDADKRSAEKRWKRQGVYIEKLARNNSQLYGELEAHIPSLKPLKEPSNLALGSGEDGNEEDQETLI
jgi:hypothetical protein